MGGIILAILGALVAILALVNNRMTLFSTGIEHFNLYLAILGAVLLVVGVFMWFRGRSAAA
jgi:LPXTG-motif cell wall-anchored protein